MPFYLKHGEIPDKRHTQHYYNNKLSFSKLGDKYGLSKEGSRLVVQRALKKLKKAALEKDLNIDDFYI